MQRYDNFAELENETGFEINRDFNLLYVVTKHPMLTQNNETRGCIIEVLSSEEKNACALEVHVLKEEVGCGSLEPVAWSLREMTRPAVLASDKSVFAGCFDTAEKWCDQPENKLIEDRFYLYFETGEAAHRVICDILSPKFNAQF